jgi:hypothetical protein
MLNKKTFIAVFFFYVAQIVNDFRKKVPNLLKTFIQKMLECIISLQISKDIVMKITDQGHGEEFDNQEVKQYAKYTLVEYIVQLYSSFFIDIRSCWNAGGPAETYHNWPGGPFVKIVNKRKVCTCYFTFYTLPAAWDLDLGTCSALYSTAHASVHEGGPGNGSSANHNQWRS